jgi:outer membrane receptor protein involved in Fe transport
VAPFTIQTDLDGYANFPVLRAGGGYILNVSSTGYATIKLENQRVKVSETVVIPVGMAEAIQEKVEVVATRQAIDIESTTTSTKFSDEFLKDLPIAGRAYQNVLALAPGVSDEDGDGNPNVNGSRETDFKAVVSGVSNVDPFSGERLNYVNPDSIEEIEVITAGAGVELGRAQGGYAKIVQKQGTNQFEGTFGMLYRSSKLDGDGANNKQPDRLFPEFKSYQPSITVSGPIKQDKLWYIVNYEYHHDEAPFISSDGAVVDMRVQPIASATMTWQASPRNKLAFKYEYDPITETNLGLENNPGRRAENLFRQEIGGPVYSVRWSAPFSPKLLVESTVAYQDSHSNQLPMTSASGPDGILGTTDDNTEFYGSCVRGLAVFAGSDCFNLNNGEQSGPARSRTAISVSASPWAPTPTSSAGSSGG